METLGTQQHKFRLKELKLRLEIYKSDYSYDLYQIGLIEGEIMGIEAVLRTIESNKGESNENM